MSNLLLKTSIIESNYDEEDSHFFLQTMQQANDWFTYSSKEYSIDDVISAIETYIMLHATVDLSTVLQGKFWTPKPVGAFRYKMIEDGSWASVSEYKPVPGFIVQGAYWSNGFYYLVSNGDFLLEANLFVDLFTKEQYNYQ